MHNTGGNKRVLRMNSKVILRTDEKFKEENLHEYSDDDIDQEA